MDPDLLAFEQVNVLARQHQVNFITRMGYTRLLKLQP